ncbi:MAG: hypothetical protein M3Q33_01770 [Acidobacteriota bacterium]|nr:hypothetical protein [Acidobacteriota bacterium]
MANANRGEIRLVDLNIAVFEIYFGKKFVWFKSKQVWFVITEASAEAAEV